MDSNAKLVVITDLDGTLLDRQTYSYEPSLNAVRRLISQKIPLVLCSSKTRAEMIPLWRELALEAPFIVENGGAICMPPDYFSSPVPGSIRRESLEILELGDPVPGLRAALADAARRCGVTVRSFSSMGPGNIARGTGLSLEASVLALQREYDEPFIVEAGNPEELFRCLSNRGFTVSRGDRFSHLTRGSDKGKAVSRLLELYRAGGAPVFSVGLGNSANDIPLLRSVNRPVVVKCPDGSWDPEILKEIPSAHRTRGIGPQGWAETIEGILTSLGR